MEADAGVASHPRPIEPEIPKTVLIVEDNNLNMKLFNDLLKIKGYMTLQDTDGRNAIDMARRHRPDLILMDIHLPGVSGLEITRILKDDPELKTIPVIALTAMAMNGDEEKILEGGCDGYVGKPISIGSFFQTVATFLE